MNQKFDYFLILDFEATCDQERSFKPPEIIEFPTVVLNAKTLQKEGEFHYYVKPIVNPKLTPFCIDLTGIQQEWVDQGLLLPEVLQKYDEWLRKQGFIESTKKIAFVTCGDWDLLTMLTSECRRRKLKKPSYFNQWINIKKEFQRFYNFSGMLGMAGMLNKLKIELTGKHHSGIDDCRNITKIVIRMIQEGCILNITSQIEEKIQESPPEKLPHPEIVLKMKEESSHLLSSLNLSNLSNPKEKGKVVQKIIQQLKERFGKEFEQLSSSDRKMLTTWLNQQLE